MPVWTFFESYVSMDDEDNLTPEKLLELRECFDSFDRNGDGTISASEFQSSLIRMNIYIPNDEVKAIIEEYDVDGNDSLDFTEFIMLVSKLDPRVGQEIEINKAFKLFDRDNNGYITRSELADALTRFGIRASDEDKEALFNLTDDNADDQINYLEFKNMLYDPVPPPSISDRKLSGTKSPPSAPSSPAPGTAKPG